MKFGKKKRTHDMADSDSGRREKQRLRRCVVEPEAYKKKTQPVGQHFGSSYRKNPEFALF